MKSVFVLILMLANSSAFADDGVYWVPVGQQLAPFAVFDVPNVEVKIREDHVKVEYTLPRELTGALNRIEFEGPKVGAGRLVLTGDNGRMDCPGPEDFSNCTVSYRDLNFDASTRTLLLQSIAKNDEELRKRELVAARFQFGGEPHGVLRILGRPLVDSGY